MQSALRAADRSGNAADGTRAVFEPEQFSALIHDVRAPLQVLRDEATGRFGLRQADPGEPAPRGTRLVAALPPMYPEWLGDRGFCEDHGLRFPYIAGEMATGIATSALVIAMARAGMLGFFGAAGLPLQQIERGIDEIEAALGESGAAWGINLIHSPNERGTEDATVELFLRRGVRLVSASAFMALTPAVVRYAATGLREDEAGRVVRERHLVAKISRPEVAAHFLSPAPEAMLRPLVAAGAITADEARLAARVPVAHALTVESDSGGHTDNRPLGGLFPTIARLRDDLAASQGHGEPVYLGAAGGLGTPSSVASAFALGAAFVMTGSVNQCAVEAGTSDGVKKLLCEAGLADVTMAPAADMFELGVKVQVLRRGTLFASRGAQLYELYSKYPGLDAIPPATRAQLEKDLFRAPLGEVWASTRAYWLARDAHEVEKAGRDPRHLMALVFRWYLGSGSRWARAGEPTRRLDYQIWCGPAMGAFNAWVKGSFLEGPAARTVEQIARNLLEGAAAVARAQQLRSAGVPVPEAAFDYPPRPLT